MKVFFYGLFMDKSLLARKGITAADLGTGFVDGYALRIGERATLARDVKARAYGAVMDIAPDEVAGLYAEKSVADYRPETVTVVLMDGTTVEASCYNLPVASVTGINKSYANALLQVAGNRGLPDAYLDEIRRAAGSPLR